MHYIIIIYISVIIVITESLTDLMFLMFWLYSYVTRFVSVFRQSFYFSMITQINKLKNKNCDKWLPVLASDIVLASL